jgi:hypothetical protein
MLDEIYKDGNIILGKVYVGLERYRLLSIV